MLPQQFYDYVVGEYFIKFINEVNKMKISFKNNNISISQEGINLNSYGGVNQFLFIAQDAAALDFFVPENVGDYAIAYTGEGSIVVYEYVSSGGGF
jgi:hypothetical protein